MTIELTPNRKKFPIIIKGIHLLEIIERSRPLFF